MPATLHDELASAAKREGISLNQLITGVLAGAVEWRTSDAPLGARRQTGDTGGLPADRELPGKLTRTFLIANFTVVLVAAIAAITLLVVAWRTG
jgi:hypothetical protein